MQIPGFTAEVTLSVRSTMHRAGEVSAGQSVDRGVLAQLRIIRDPVSECFSWCFLNGGSPLGCFFRCGPGQLTRFV